ncbi:MAG TPA: hypothetical protein VJ797_09975, partial [Burkholderiales bacterium]|nr:hypothetical protein [Burkholderiales bacterium]
AGEQGLAGWTISIDDDSDPDNGVVASVLTGGDGSYFFDLSLPLDDTYYLYEQLQLGWEQTSGGATIVVDALGHVTSDPAGAIGDTGGSGALGVAGPLNFGNFHPEPSLNIVKDATVPGGTADVAGEEVSYQITVQNTGNVPLTGVIVTDPFVSSITRVADVAGDNDNLLEVGETWAYTASHVVTQAEIDSNGGGDGDIDNTATADSNESDEDSDDAIVPVDQNPALLIVKDADAGQVADLAGEVLTYSISVQNTGNQTLTGVTVSDPNADAGSIVRGADLVGDDDDLLEVGETWSFDAAHTLTQAEIDSNGGGDGDIDNTATADSNESDEDSDDAIVPVDQNPALEVTKAANKSAVDRADQLITYTIVLTNAGNTTLTGVLADDTLLGALTAPVESLSANGKLDVGETWTYGPTHNVTQSEIDENIYTVTFGPSGTFGQEWDGQTSSIALSGGSDGDIDNTVTADTDQTDPQDASAAVNVAHIDIEKFVSVDGGTTWVDADSPTGPTLISTSGIDPLFKFVVTNTGNVDLSNVVLTDSVFELNGLADDGNGATAGYGVGDLASGDSAVVTFEDAVWKFGQHSNTGTAAGQYNNGQQLLTVQDTDEAHYFGMLGALVTSSSLCTFDTNSDLAGDQFNLIFTPDFKLGGSNYKLSGGNPGQFYYNLFFQGDAYEDVSFTLDIPFPFVTQGATPIHVYDDVRVDQEHGEICLTPIGEMANYKLTDDGVHWTYVDANANDQVDVGDTYRLLIENVDLGDDGFVYLNVHLDYGLEKQTGWVKSSPVSGTDNALDNGGVNGTQPAIMDGHSYDFSALADGYAIDGSSDSIINDNTFKNIKGLGGLFQADESGTEGLDQTAVKGQHLGIFKSDGTFMGDAWTDEDGWYYAQFNATGSKTNYKVVWDQDGDGNYAEHLSQNDHVKTVEMGGNAGKWVNVDFTVVDPVDTSVGIDSYGSLL